MEKRFTFPDLAGRRISAVLVLPPRTEKIVVLCHGFMGYKDSWTNRTLSQLLAQQHIATLRFDFFGHGESDGDIKELLLTTLVAQTESAIALARGQGFPHIGLLGSSFGGLIATLVAAKTTTLAALALRCPVADFPDILRRRFGRAAIALWRRIGTVPPSIADVPVHAQFYEDCLRYDPYRAAEELRVPTVIVHGDKDEIIPVEQAYALHRHIGAEKALHIIPGADHRFSSPMLFARMANLLVDWMVRYLSLPVPS